MKIITWNCNMAFRNKAEAILQHKPDILIVQECEHPDKLTFTKGSLRPTDTFWYGTKPHKGVGIFSYSSYKFKLMEDHNPEFKTVLPLSVTGGSVDFTLFAIWANNPHDKDGQYVTQVWKAIHYYDAMLNTTKIILTGDFNSNTIWDKPRRVGNHSDVIAKLESKNILSAYHHFYRQPQGKERHPTFYLYRHLNKPYHLDYCLASSYFIQKLKKVEIGRHHKWTRYSDHTPLSVTFND